MERTPEQSSKRPNDATDSPFATVQRKSALLLTPEKPNLSQETSELSGIFRVPDFVSNFIVICLTATCPG